MGGTVKTALESLNEELANSPSEVFSLGAILKAVMQQPEFWKQAEGSEQEKEAA